MSQETTAVVVDQARLSIEELSVSCAVGGDWVIEHVQAGVLLNDSVAGGDTWTFSGQDLRRARRLLELERTFDAVPELAGLVVDLLEERERLRARLLRAGLTPD
ncbi:MAG TPA: MerR family transcriptional regulator [Burkholderiaceae bacterium]|jgi:chaperone modulatory protein CbpM